MTNKTTIIIGGRDYVASVGGLLLPTAAPVNLLPVSPPVRPPGPQERADPDGPLVPLPERTEPARVPPPFPLTAYRAMVGDG